MPAKRKSEDELTPEELPEIGLHEGDRPIQTYDYLGSTEEGKAVCMFPAIVDAVPSGIQFPSYPDLDVIDLIQELIIKNPSGPGLITVPFNSIVDEGKPLPKKILGAVVDGDIIKQMLGTNPDGSANTNGRGILLTGSNDLTLLTMAEWTAAHGSDGLAAKMRARLSYLSTGGGVSTPSQQVTGPGQKGIARKGKKEFKKLGKY